MLDLYFYKSVHSNGVVDGVFFLVYIGLAITGQYLNCVEQTNKLDEYTSSKIASIK